MTALLGIWNEWNVIKIKDQFKEIVRAVFMTARIDTEVRANMLPGIKVAK